MAIETTYFTGTTAEANEAEVYAWLTANAMDYFDEITDENHEIICKKDGVNSLFFNCSGGSTHHTAVMSKNGVVIWSYYALDITNEYYWNRAIKTDSGLVFVTKNNLATVFVSKTTNGDLFYVYCGSYKTGSNCVTAIADFEKSSNFNILEPTNGYLTDPKRYGVLQSAKTALVPALSDVGTYSENLFFVPYTQFSGPSIMTIEIDGTKYVYNGFFALKE